MFLDRYSYIHLTPASVSYSVSASFSFLDYLMPYGIGHKRNRKGASKARATRSTIYGLPDLCGFYGQPWFILNFRKLAWLFRNSFQTRWNLNLKYLNRLYFVRLHGPLWFVLINKATYVHLNRFTKK